MFYTSLIDGYCKGGNLGEAMRHCDEMVGRGYLLTIETYTVFMSGLCRECRLDEENRLFA